MLLAPMVTEVPHDLGAEASRLGHKIRCGRACGTSHNFSRNINQDMRLKYSRRNS